MRLHPVWQLVKEAIEERFDQALPSSADVALGAELWAQVVHDLKGRNVWEMDFFPPLQLKLGALDLAAPVSPSAPTVCIHLVRHPDPNGCDAITADTRLQLLTMRLRECFPGFAIGMREQPEQGPHGRLLVAIEPLTDQADTELASGDARVVYEAKVCAREWYSKAWVVSLVLTSRAEACDPSATARQLERAAVIYPGLVRVNPVLPLLRLSQPGLLSWL